MPIDAFASEPSYARHIAPLWEALSHEERGAFYTGRAAAPYITRHLVKGPLHIGAPVDGNNITLCSAFQDSRYIRSRNRKVIYLEHGCGQTYSGDMHGKDHPAYSGGREHEPGTLAILCPGPLSANNWRAAYPELPIHEIGPTYLDPWLSGEVTHAPSTPPIVAISFHANVRLCPETQSAFAYYERALFDLRDSDEIQLLGHSHPRDWRGLEAWYGRNGIVAVENFTDILRLADIYAVDNSSTLYEFAATGRPVVAMNAPHFRRSIHHGLRFWDLIPGLQCDRPGDLLRVILEASQDPVEAQELRERAVAAVYHPRDGRAIQRGVEAIRATVRHQEELASA